ncbi:MAG: cell wall-binding repeat-containing protein [Coriobacteriales bacterium]|nr:cell wall-binding repeat-containing protein [Actinomycetes bacterium]
MKKARLVIIAIMVVAVLGVGVAALAVGSDTTDPTTFANASAVYYGDATVKLTAYDDADGKGISYMYYRIDKHATQLVEVEGAPVHTVTLPAPETGSTQYRLRYWSQDGAGNVEDINSLNVTVKAGTLTPPSTMLTRIQGTNRYETAVAASKAGFSSASAVVIARGDLFADALGGAALAGAVDGPLLLTSSTSVPESAIAEIKRLGATKVYILGSEGAISAKVFDQLKTAAGSAERLGGTNRYDTAQLVARKTIELLGASYDGSAFLATGSDFPDALGAAPVSYAKGMPVVLAAPDGSYTLPAGVTKVYILGGTSVVPESVQRTLGSAYAGRLAGATRYATAVAIAKFGVGEGMSWNGCGVASGVDPADALSGGPLLGAKNTVLLLTTPTTLAAETGSAIAENTDLIREVRFLGGTGAVSDDCLAAIGGLFQ